MAEYYSAELSQKVLRGMNETRRKGLFTGGTIIYGYRVKDKKVEIYEPEAEIVRYIFNESAAGKAGNLIIEELNERGILVCPHCGASILADIDENGRMILKVEPAQEPPKPAA